MTDCVPHPPAAARLARRRLPTSTDFVPLVDQVPDRADFPHAADVVERVLIYDAASAARMRRPTSRVATGSRPSWSGR